MPAKCHFCEEVFTEIPQVSTSYLIESQLLKNHIDKTHVSVPLKRRRQNSKHICKTEVFNVLIEARLKLKVDYIQYRKSIDPELAHRIAEEKIKTALQSIGPDINVIFKD